MLSLAVMYDYEVLYLVKGLYLIVRFYTYQRNQWLQFSLSDTGFLYILDFEIEYLHQRYINIFDLHNKASGLYPKQFTC